MNCSIILVLATFITFIALANSNSTTIDHDFCKNDVECPANFHCYTTVGFCEPNPGFKFATNPNGTFQTTIDGKHIAEDIDECKTGIVNCSNLCPADRRLHYCRNTPGSFDCLCPNGDVAVQCECPPMKVEESSMIT